MKFNKRKILLSLGMLGAIAPVTMAIMSCAANPNSGIQPKHGKLAYTIYLKDGTPVKVTYKQFMDYLKTHPGANTTQQMQYDNQIIKWLYKDESYSSVYAHEENPDVPQLTSYDDVYKDSKKQLNDDKKSIMNRYGTSWEQEWSKTLLSSKYGGSFSEEQAIEYIAVSKMKTNALKRFTIQIDSKTYKNYDIGDKTDYPFLKDYNTIEGNNDNAITFITGSYDDVYKDPTKLLKTYMDHYQYAINIRHILYALKVGTTYKDPWTLSIDSIKKLYSKWPGAQNVVWQNLKDLGYGYGNKTASENWATNPKTESSSLAAKIVGNYSDNAGAAKTYGSLGMSTIYDDVKNLVPGFAIPIASDLINNNKSTITHPQIPTITPVATDLNFDTALKASGYWKSTDPSKDPNIINDITTNLADANKLKLVLDNIKSQLSTNGTRQWEYTLNNSSISDQKMQTHFVFSKDGIHMIYPEVISEDKSQNNEGWGLNSWIKSDLERTDFSNSLIYNVSKAINTKIAPSDNFSPIYNLVENEPAGKYPNSKSLHDFVLSQKNYANHQNANFTDDNIQTAKNIANTLFDNTKQTDILSTQKKYTDWWDKNIYQNELVNPGNIKINNVLNMINNLGLVDKIANIGGK